MNSRILMYSDLKPFMGFLDDDSGINLTYMRACIALATPGYTCLRPPGAAGAILVFPNGMGLSALGCVEPPSGYTCKELGECEMEDGHCVRAIHAEVNAILTAAKTGHLVRGGVMYSILKPCYQCTKVIIAAGIAKVYYASAAYDEVRTRNLAATAGLIIERLEGLVDYGH